MGLARLGTKFIRQRPKKYIAAQGRPAAAAVGFLDARFLRFFRRNAPLNNAATPICAAARQYGLMRLKAFPIPPQKNALRKRELKSGSFSERKLKIIRAQMRDGNRPSIPLKSNLPTRTKRAGKHSNAHLRNVKKNSNLRSANAYSSHAHTIHTTHTTRSAPPLRSGGNLKKYPAQHSECNLTRTAANTQRNDKSAGHYFPF